MNRAGKDQEAVLANLAQRKKLAKVRAAMETARINRERRAQAHNN